ncbi:MAG: FHA domain-containing protein [Eubacterium sp.]
MNKKIISVVLSLITALTVLLSFANCAFASESKIRAVNVNLPDVTFEVSGKFSQDDFESVKLDSEELSLKKVYNGSDAESKIVYMLVDISTSMSQSALNSLKPSLINYATSLGENDKLILMTFGTQVKTVLKGGESNKVIKEKINSLKCNSGGTTFYKALNKALDESVKKNDYDRKFAIVVSDGADFEKGNSSQQEVIDKYNTHRLPVYGMCLSSASKSEADGFGYIARTSGGELVKFSSSNASTKFDSIKKEINNVTVAEFTSKNKKSTGRKNLDVKINGKKLSQEVTVNAKSDKTAPEIDSISFNKESNSFEIVFSEDVENADKISSYEIKKNDKTPYTIVSVKYNDCKANINMDKKVYSGDYTFYFNSITDISDNENELKNNVIQEEIKANPIILKILIIIGIICIPLAFLLALYLVLLNLKKKKNVDKIKDIFVAQVNEKEFERVHIEQPKGKTLKISIDAGNGQYHSMEYNLLKSLIVGRGDICDVSIDDVNMSRQHFALEEIENGLAVIDLQTTNGTYVNGVQIKSRTFLPSGSKITAGNSTITIYY